MDDIYLHAQRVKVGFLGDVAAAYNDPNTFPDLIVECLEGVTIQVHKLVVCKRAAWFQKACSSGFKESNSNHIKLQDNSDEVHAMLSYCYSFKYKVPEKISDPEHIALFNVRMFAMAEFYQVRGLAKVATDELAATILRLFRAGGSIVAKLSSAIKYAYENITDPQKVLRRVITTIVSDFLQYILVEEKGEFRKLLEDIPPFAVDMAMVQAARISKKAEKEIRELNGFNCTFCENDVEDEKSLTGRHITAALSAVGWTLV